MWQRWGIENGNFERLCTAAAVRYDWAIRAKFLELF